MAAREVVTSGMLTYMQGIPLCWSLVLNYSLSIEQLHRRQSYADRVLHVTVWSAGGHFKSNKSTGLPEGSFRTTKKGYDEVRLVLAVISCMVNQGRVSDVRLYSGSAQRQGSTVVRRSYTAAYRDA
jgi:hypothetical protein